MTEDIPAIALKLPCLVDQVLRSLWQRLLKWTNILNPDYGGMLFQYVKTLTLKLLQELH